MGNQYQFIRNVNPFCDLPLIIQVQILSFLNNEKKLRFYMEEYTEAMDNIQQLEIDLRATQDQLEEANDHVFRLVHSNHNLLLVQLQLHAEIRSLEEEKLQLQQQVSNLENTIDLTI